VPLARTIRRRFDPQALRAAWWALRALGRTRRQLRAGKLEDVVLAAPPALGPSADHGVNAVLRRARGTCLERSLVLQRWLAARGDARDVVIGVSAPATGFRAHAWLDGEPAGDFDELLRLHP
jgi:Transglutaminase-like superfamily